MYNYIFTKLGEQMQERLSLSTPTMHGDEIKFVNEAFEKNWIAPLGFNCDNFEKEIKQFDGVALIDFYADWCGPCRMLSPVVDEIATEREDILVGKINVDEEEDLAREFGIFSIPTLVVMKGGRVVSQSAGVRPKAQILAMLEG